ncbi:Glutaminase [seawater metagenome]|uniref:glutaminase n=1 Tax=seawater metagenome TaxID=1561972 RepID=A0A5E8CKQ4_9ZZZZ
MEDNLFIQGSPTNSDIDLLFDSINLNNENRMEKEEILKLIETSGIQKNDSRLALFFKNLNKIKQAITKKEFKSLISCNQLLLNKIIKGDLCIPNWSNFTQDLEHIFESVKDNSVGNLASYIPQLAKVDENLFSVCVTSVDGQQYSIGDNDHHFCIQSCSKPISYCIAVQEHGEKIVHNHIGREPSGKNFNELCLNENMLPHNPLINSGSIMAVSLIKYRQSASVRFDHIIEYWRRLAGGSKINFNNSVYLSERASADRNFCLGYMMQENKSFSKGKDQHYEREWDEGDLQRNLELYFQCCSIEVNCQQASVIAASLANGGICPTSDDKVFSSENVKNVLSLMSSCGMYDYSGEWAYTIGIPAKSGVSGIIMGVIPNVMGIAVYSPKLDELGNSVRGINFFKKLVGMYSFHTYDSILIESKKIITKNNEYHQEFNTYLLLNSASKGDIAGIQRLISKGVDINSEDYDKRTALHLAASEGKESVIRFLLSKNCNILTKDRWGNTAYDDAIENNHQNIIALLSNS